MPFKSKQQEKWAFTKAGEKALGGPVKVKEWVDASKGINLPQKVSTPVIPKISGHGYAMNGTPTQVGSDRD